MTSPALSRSIIEDLYSEALLLADEARAVFDPSDDDTPDGPDRDAVKLALSVEGLKTTTRVMHVLAWLLNQRAYFSGELSERQLHAFGGLQDGRPSDEDQLQRLLPQTRALIRDSERLHARVARLDADRRAQAAADAVPVSVVGQMQGRIAAAFGQR